MRGAKAGAPVVALFSKSATPKPRKPRPTAADVQAQAAAAAEGGSGVSRKATPEAGDPPLDPMEC